MTRTMTVQEAGKMGGRKRAQVLTPERMSEIAKKGSEAAAKKYNQMTEAEKIEKARKANLASLAAKRAKKGLK